jgi:hypothetical protein
LLMVSQSHYLVSTQQLEVFYRNLNIDKL